ncbi:hypothetical protein TSUD_318530 [Trifolium subterraneum]|uniref:Uncharacterized protein n=1 Tax=Trifolium subterraneum TaxID=3900 RepID=A0A2Z6MVP5_TRISU|nr:hypothetical protein TSUD_318530 [Trifolium subterraneum]
MSLGCRFHWTHLYCSFELSNGTIEGTEVEFINNIQIELRAFCSKHSDLQENRNILPLGGSIAVGSEIPEANVLPVTFPVKSEHNLKIGCSNGGLESDSNRDKLNHNDGGLPVFSAFFG